VLASLQRYLVLVLAHITLQSQHNLFGSLGLLVEYWLRLSAKALLLAIVTAFPLHPKRRFASLVLRYFVRGVFAALFALAKGIACFWYVDHPVLLVNLKKPL